MSSGKILNTAKVRELMRLEEMSQKEFNEGNPVGMFKVNEFNGNIIFLAADESDENCQYSGLNVKLENSCSDGHD